MPLLSSYAERISSSLDAFESLSFGLILPGALAEGRAATQGLGGVQRLVRAGVSAKWIGEKCIDLGDDTVSQSFRFHLYYFIYQLMLLIVLHRFT